MWAKRVYRIENILRKGERLYLNIAWVKLVFCLLTGKKTIAVQISPGKYEFIIAPNEKLKEIQT